MLEMLLNYKDSRPIQYLSVDFEDQEVGSTSIIDKTGNFNFVLTGANTGSVINDPTMGKCFQFTGVSGYRSTTPINWNNKNLLITVNCQAADTSTQRSVISALFMGTTSRREGFYLTVNATDGARGYAGDSGSAMTVYAGSRTSAQRTLDLKIGAVKGTSLSINGVPPTGAANGQPYPFTGNGGQFIYISSTAIALPGVSPFSGKIKSISITEI